MLMSFAAREYGQLLNQKFMHLASASGGREVCLFRCLREAMLSTAPHFKVEEFHGNRSQVVFPANPPWTKTVARCELADLCIVWFRRRPQLSARITFLQAKRSHSSYKLCCGMGDSINESFIGDSTQWYLLHNRPLMVGRYQTFQPPTNLLKDSILPSVGSYCVFHKTSQQEYSFFYASAGIITPGSIYKPGLITLTADSISPIEQIDGFPEQRWACCPLIFGQALFSGLIGTPFHDDSVATTIDPAWSSSVRNWLGSILLSAVQRGETGPVIGEFVSIFDMRFSEVNTSPPAKSLLFIQGDTEDLSE